MEENTNQPISNVNASNLPSNPPVSSSTSVPTRKKLPRILILGIILFLLIAGVTAGFFVFKKQSLKTVAKATPTPIVQKLNPTPTPDPASNAASATSDWKTHTGNGYSFKYPTEFANEKCPKGAFSTSLCTDGLDKSIEPIFYYIDFQNESVLPQIQGLQINYKEETINGVSVLRTNDLPSRSGAETVYFKNPNGGYVSILFTPYDKQNSFPQQEKYYNLFGQILSTIRFE